MTHLLVATEQTPVILTHWRKQIHQYSKYGTMWVGLTWGYLVLATGDMDGTQTGVCDPIDTQVILNLYF